MKIGDKVRFLNEVGGGIVTGFQGKNIVTVQDEDGFDIPVAVHECVVVDTDEYNIDYSKKGASPAAKEAEQAPTSIKAQLSKTDAEGKEEEDEVDDERPVTFRPAPVERKGGERLNVYLCFVPVDVHTLSSTDFETYVINDSNYFLDFAYLCAESNGWQLRSRGTVEPNTKLYIETFSRDKINDLQHLCLQMYAYKENKTFLLKPVLSAELRPDLTKFYKLHTFAPNDFFEERVLTLDVVRDDAVRKQVFVEAEEVREVLLGEKKKIEEDTRTHIKAIALKKEKPDDILQVDLHAASLLDNQRGMSAADILEYQLGVFRKTMEEHKSEKGRKIVFIHGKGQGVLRNAVLRELSHLYKNCTSQDASFREYGFGATMVIVH